MLLELLRFACCVVGLVWCYRVTRRHSHLPLTDAYLRTMGAVDEAVEEADGT